MRIVCAKKKNETKAQFIGAVQRVGCNASIPVDNLSRGGMAISINSDTGELGYGRIERGESEIVGRPLSEHPDTQSKFYGRKVPNWDKIVAELLELTNKLPYLNFVAWDILLTDEGMCVIEGNASSGVGLFQMESGIRNSEFGEVLKSYNIIS